MKAFPNPNNTSHDGMDLRDYFAAKAMQAMLTNQTLHAGTMTIADRAGIPEEEALAKMSFLVADAMMNWRKE